MAPARSTAERSSHARARLEADSNVWVATASSDGTPHLVPLSLAWIDDQIVVATAADTPTGRNVIESGKARAALDSADDVVIIDADARVVLFADAEPSMVERYVERVGWDPSNEPGQWALLVLTPTRGQAWIGPAEIAGRTFIRNGTWLS